MRLKRQFAAILFDLDGVLVDSEQVHAAAYQELFATEGLEFTLDDFRAVARGVPRREVIMRTLGPHISSERLAELMQHKAELVVDALAGGNLRPVEGALEFVRDSRNAGIPRAVASVSNMPAAFLDAVGALDEFDVVLGRDSVEWPKPDPAVYLECARRLGVSPQTCIAIEDSAAGVQSAKAAGMTVLAITTTASAEELSSADVVCSNFAEIRRHVGL